MIGQCNKCGAEAEILKGHLGKKHKSCGGRKHNASKINCGIWIEKPKENKEEEKEK